MTLTALRPALRIHTVSMYFNHPHPRFLLAACGLLALAGGAAATSTAPRRSGVAAAYHGLPIYFEANQGQTDPRVAFVSRGNGYQLFLSPDEAVLSVRRAQ